MNDVPIGASAFGDSLYDESSDAEAMRTHSAEPPSSAASRDVVFIHSDAYYRALSRLPVHPQREHMTLALLRALAAAQQAQRTTGDPGDCQTQSRLLGMQLIAPSLATDDQLMRFHARDYVDTLRRTSAPTNNTSRGTITTTTLGGEPRSGGARHGRPVSDQECEEYELVDDAYVFPGLYEYCRFVAGASLTAADALRYLIPQWRARQSMSPTASAPVAINLGGGRHHAMRSQASGFCYVNDVVLAIQRLLSPSTIGSKTERLERVLCIDIDVHHGDGVQEAFFFSPNVTTLSFHLFERTFFPGTGAQDETGVGRGKNHNINVPLRRGIVDAQFHTLFESIVGCGFECVDPHAVVLVCGVDTLARDSLGGFNLTSRGITECVQTLIGFNRPLLVLGGGGYSGADACRALASVVTAAVAPGIDVSDLEVPEHEFFEEYGPDFRMATKPVIHRPNENTDESLAQVSEIAIATFGKAKQGRLSREASRCEPKRKRS